MQHLERCEVVPSVIPESIGVSRSALARGGQGVDHHLKQRHSDSSARIMEKFSAFRVSTNPHPTSIFSSLSWGS